MNEYNIDLISQNNPYARFTTVAHSQQTDGRSEEQKTFFSPGQAQDQSIKDSQGHLLSSPKSKRQVQQNHSPATSTRRKRKGNGNNRNDAQRSSHQPVKIPDKSSMTSTAGNVIVANSKSYPAAFTKGSSSLSSHINHQSINQNDNRQGNDNQSGEITQKGRSSRKQQTSKQGTTTLEGGTSMGSEHQKEKPKVSSAEKKRIQEASKKIIWEQNESYFIVGKSRDRIFNNTFLTLNSVKYQPQKSCNIYTKIQNRVNSIEIQKRNKITRLIAKTKSNEPVTQTTVSLDSSQKQTVSSQLSNRLKLSNHNSFKKPNNNASNKDNLKAANLSLKGGMPTVSEVQELNEPSQLKDVPIITDGLQTSQQSIPSEYPLTKNESNLGGSFTLKQQQPKLVQGNANQLQIQTQQTLKLKGVTDHTKTSQDCESQSIITETNKLDSVEEESLKVSQTHILTTDQEQQDKKEKEDLRFSWQNKAIDEAEIEKAKAIDNKMIAKLFKGEFVGGKFADIQIESFDAKETTGFRLAHFQAKDVEQSKNTKGSKSQKRSNKSAFLQAESKRNDRLNKKLKSVVNIAKQRLCKNPAGTQKFRKIVEDLNLQDNVESSEDSDEDEKKRNARAQAEHKKAADQRLREKLVRMGRIKKPEDLKNVDSLLESAYNSAKALEWGQYTDHVGNPRCSFDTEEDFDIFSQSGDDSQESKESVDIQEQVKKEGRLTMNSKNNPLDQMKMSMLGFESGFAIADSSNLIHSIKKKIAELNGLGTYVPETTAKVIYQKLCDELQTAPIDVFKRIQKETQTLKFENYGLNTDQAKPLSLIIPFIQKIESVVMKNCGLKDKAAASIITASLGKRSMVSHLDFTGIELGRETIRALEQNLIADPSGIKELIFADLKPIVPIGLLLRTLQLSKELQYLDLSQNKINYYSIDSLGDLIKGTQTLHYLSLKSCDLRGKIAEKVMDALMLNSTIQYLDLSSNRFTTDERHLERVVKGKIPTEYMIAGKLGRLVQGHPQLLHVDLSHNQMKREELIFLIMCVRDSKNIQGFHLTGNRVNHYDRLLMRSLLPCKVKYPLAPSYAPKFERVTSHDKVTLIMLNMCFMTAIPPNFIPEIGLAEVKTIEDVREKIRSHEKRRQIDEDIEWNREKEYKMTEVHYTELIEYRLQSILAEKQKRATTYNRQDQAHMVDSSRQILTSSRSNAGKIGNFNKYYNDPDARIYDMFQMIDFYGRKKKCLQLGMPLTKQDDKWYHDQRHRLLQRIQEMKASQPEIIIDYEEKLAEMKAQVAEINQLIGPDSKDKDSKDTGNKNQQLKPGFSSMKSFQTEDLSLQDGLLISPLMDENMNKLNEAELSERILDKKLKTITRDCHDQKTRAKNWQRQLDDNNVISRVKQLMSMPNDNVSEKGGYGNPMRGLKDQLIFTRITGHPNTIDNNIWFDTSECWVCAEHNKFKVEVSSDERLIDQEFDQIIMLTAMMTKRTQRRKLDVSRDQDANLEILLEEQSNKSINTDSNSNTSGSGADIEGNGDPAYANQTKKERGLNLFNHKLSNTSRNGNMLAQTESFGSHQDDGENSKGELEAMMEYDRFNRKPRVIEKWDQVKAVSFLKYTEPRNIIPLGRELSDAISITTDPRSNLTLFNPALTARPIQLKNVLKTVYHEYNGAQGPDRFNQPNHKYHAINGVLYRNLHNQQSIVSKLNKNTVEKGPKRKISENKLAGNNAKKDTKFSQIDLSSEALLFNSDKMMTKFEIKDSALSKQIEILKQKENYHSVNTVSNTQDASAKKNNFSNMHENSSTALPSERRTGQAAYSEEADDPHAMWLMKRGLGPQGQLPPVTIKGTGREFWQGQQIQQPKTADHNTRSRRNITVQNNASLKQSSMRQAFTGYATTRHSSLAGMRHQRRAGILPGTTNAERVTSIGIFSDKHKDSVPSLDSDQEEDVNAENQSRKSADAEEKKQRQKKQKNRRNTHVAYNPNTKPKQEEEDNFNQFWAIFNQQEETDAIYLVSSINHWMPIKLSDPQAKSVQGLTRRQTMRANSERSSMIMTARKGSTIGNNALIESSKSSQVPPMKVVQSPVRKLDLSGIVVEDADRDLDEKIKPQGKLTNRFLRQDPKNSSAVCQVLHDKGKFDTLTDSQERDQQMAMRKEQETVERFVKPIPDIIHHRDNLCCCGAPLDENKQCTKMLKNGQTTKYFGADCPSRSKHNCTLGHGEEGEGDLSCQISRPTMEQWHEKLKYMKAIPRKQREVQRKVTQDAIERQVDFKTFETNMFCRPGKHFFFFIRRGKHFMLSQKYDIERYKQTNVQMNFVIIKNRGWRIGKPMVDRDEEWKQICDQTEGGEESFDKAKSVFRNYRLDNETYVRKMFENDLRLTKISAKVKDKDQLEKVKESLYEHYEFIKMLFLSLSCDSAYPAVNRTDFDIFALTCRLQERVNVDEAKINLQREGSLVKNELTKKIADGTTKNDMLRFQFLEVIFRLAELCYQGEIKTDNDKNEKTRSSGKKKKGSGKIYLFQAINKLFKDHIYPHYDPLHYAQDRFREEYLYTYRVNQYYERNEPVIKRIHAEYNYAGKHCLSPIDAVNFVTVIGGLAHIKERFVMRLYGYSKQSNIDYLKTPVFPKELAYVEFLEFFGRLAFWTFEQLDETHPYLNFEMEERLDALLAHYCKKLKLTRVFQILKEEQNEVVSEVIDYMKALEKREVFMPAESMQDSVSHQESGSAVDHNQSIYSARGSVAGGAAAGKKLKTVSPILSLLGQDTLKIPLDKLPSASLPKDLQKEEEEE